ncbi:SMP-30/gluconolactonase/LRE family protein [Pseudomonas psychrophila]|uniref:SMP-30/gluconolactonase/LRE family protein n=1 Tax=Pseudomonas psychrophila TaxID=122355 RepID=UPI0039B5CA6B
MVCCLLRYDRHGELTRVLDVPVPRPTSCCFGGPDMSTLFITSARFGMSPAELADCPAAGKYLQYPCARCGGSPLSIQGDFERLRQVLNPLRPILLDDFRPVAGSERLFRKQGGC